MAIRVFVGSVGVAPIVCASGRRPDPIAIRVLVGGAGIAPIICT